MTEQVVLIGRGISYSASPAMFTAAFAACGMDWRYALCDVEADDLARVVAQLRSGELRGANVTQPHKAAVMPLLDEVSEESVRVAAVNTIVRQANGRLRGETTDLPALADELDALAAAAGVADPAERDQSRGSGSSRGADPAQRDQSRVTGHSATDDPAQRDQSRGSASSRGADPAQRDQSRGSASSRGVDPAQRDQSRGSTSSRGADPAQREQSRGSTSSRGADPAQRDQSRVTGRSATDGPAERDERGRDPSHSFARAVILGRGGAARTAAAALEDRGAQVALVGRDDWAGLEALLAGVDLLVNATPIGTGGADAPIPRMMLRPDLAVLDLVYRPSPTDLVTKAREAGAVARGGAGMLLGQAARSFTLWTGLDAPLEAMRGALRAELGEEADV